MEEQSYEDIAIETYYESPFYLNFQEKLHI